MVQVFKYKSFIAICILAATVILFPQCKKDNGTTPVIKDTVPTAKTYLPVSAGSTFSYHSIVNTDTTDYMLTATTGDSVVNGRSYTKFTGSDGKTRYRTRIDSNYYQVSSFSSLPGFPVFEDNYLKANAAVNTTWTSILKITNVLGLPPEYVGIATYKLIAKANSVTVNGTLYTNVIHVRLADVSAYNDSTLTPPAQLAAVATGDFYYSLGVGLIQSSLDVPDNTPYGISEFHSLEKITAYHIQ